MRNRKRNDGLPLVEVLILIGIVGCVIVFLLPAVLAVRESARRTECVNRMKELGFAVHGYLDAHKSFPPSSHVTTSADGKITAVDGWCWIALSMPYWRQSTDGHGSGPAIQQLYEHVDLANGRPLVEPAGAKGTPHADLLAVSLPELLCPSYDGSPYADPSTRTAAITNYRAMGATHRESLSVASPHPLKPKYGEGEINGIFQPSTVRRLHPDGACFPGDGLSLDAMRKGTRHILFAAESLEPRSSRWTVGAEAAIVGLPPIVEFERDAVRGCSPKGYRKALDKDPGANATYWTYHTYLDWDYGRQPYVGVEGTPRSKYGPSSNHNDVVNHLLADGHVWSMDRSIDVTVYMGAITRELIAPC
jgi:hypothetical protein